VKPVRAPTLIIGVEDFGEAAVKRLDAEIRALEEVPVRTLVVRAMQGLDVLHETLSKIVDELLRTRLKRVGVGRLDIAILGDLAGPHRNRVGQVLDVVSDVLVGFREALPMPSSPDQRTVTMVAMLGIPALITVDDVRPLHAIEEWHEKKAKTKALSRVFALSRQHAGGTLDDDDVLRGVVLLASSVYLAGLRDHDEVGARLQHRPDGELMVLFNAAAADVPVDSIVKYCAWRTALEGAETLHARCASSRIHGARELAHCQMDYQGWLAGLRSGDAARKAKTFDSMELRAVAPTVSSSFGWRDPESQIRSELRPLLEHARRGPVEGVESGPSVDSETLWQLDRAELEQLEAASESIEAFLREELAPNGGAKNLPVVAAALDEVEEAMRSRSQRAVEATQRQEVEPHRVPERELWVVEEALRHRVSPWAVALTGFSLACLAALVAGTAVITATAAPGAVPVSGTAAGVTITKAASAGTTSAPWDVLVAAALASLMLGGGWLIVRVREQRLALSAAITELRNELTSQQRKPTTGGSVAALALRERRLASALLQRTIAARQRVAGVRAAISTVQDRARRELRALGYIASDGQRPDDARAVLGAESPLHRHLVGADGLERLWRGTRLTAEDDYWASQLFSAAWPSAGLTHDLPFLPGGTWETEAIVNQHRRLLDSSVFGWTEVREDVAERLRRFVVQAVDPSVVGLAVAPADADGVRLASNQRAAVLVIAPQEAQGLLDAVGDVRFPYKKALAATALSRVVVLRAHPGCSAGEIAWGVQARTTR